MLRGALTPDHGALTMEIQHHKDKDGEDDFVLVERVSDSLRVLGIDEDEWLEAQLEEKPAVSSETTITGGRNIETQVANGQGRQDHLPAVPAPKLVQSPPKIPPLYPFSRIQVYVLVSPDAAQGVARSVILKGSSTENPFVLEVPIEALPKCGEMIHQLAAKRAITELEEGRGWLVHAEDENGVLMKEKHPARFQSMVEREAVHIGIQFQIAGKFTSFIATETAHETSGKTVVHAAGIVEGALNPPPISGPRMCSTQSGAPTSVGSSDFGAPASAQHASFGSRATGALFHGSMQGTPALFGNSAYEMAPRKKISSKAAPKRKAARSLSIQAHSAPISEVTGAEEETDPLQKIIALQTFEGSWNLDAQLLEIVGLLAQHQAPHDVEPKVWATLLAIRFLEGRMSGEREVWVMVVEKAREWLRDMEEGGKRNLEKEWTLAKQSVVGAD